MGFSPRKTKGPLVSVLISTYNRPAYVAEAVGSILHQTYENVEIVLVRDGGSPVREVVQHFDDPRLHFIDRDQNRGLPFSFNQALSKAKGKYICYLGDDDILYPNHVQVLVNALEGQDEYQVAYTDLYKVHCRVMPDGRRIVLSKNVEISRDFDRMAMLQFNHTLHVSLMHRRDLIDKIGPYNEKLNVLIDWDLTRRLSFFTDFKHIHKVTGEYYAPVGDCDRISIKRRKNVNEYIYNLLTIRSTRPAKPWPKVGDLSIILLAKGIGMELDQSLREIWSHTFYPCQIYLPLPEADLLRLKTVVPNILGVTTPKGASEQQRVDAALESCEGDYVAIVPTAHRIKFDEVAWVEKSVKALIGCDDPMQAFEIVGSCPEKPMAVFRREQLKQAREKFGHLPLQQSLSSAGIKLRPPKQQEYPFQFENLFTGAEEVERQGDKLGASKIYAHIAEYYDNKLWMDTRRANALYYAGKIDEAADIISNINKIRPTVATLMIEARARKKKKDYQKAIELLQKAEKILEGRLFPEDIPVSAVSGGICRTITAGD